MSLRSEAKNQPHLRFELAGSTFLVLTSITHHLWPRPLDPIDIEDALEIGGDFLTAGAGRGPVPEEFSSLLRRHIISPVPTDTSGIKFFIWLALSELLPSERARATVEQELIRVVNTTPHIYGTSVYSGSSGSASYLVTGRLKPEHYETLARELQPRLSALGEPFIATNTDTALSTLFGPIDRVEKLLDADITKNAPDVPQGVPDLAALLTMEESEGVEFKGSALTHIPVGSAEDSQGAAASNRDKKVRDAITKSCAGFLNSNGGILVIGVVEPGRIPLGQAQAYNSAATEVGQYIVVGVDHAVDGRRLTWDQFERRLRALLSDSITPRPDPWIRILRLDSNGLDVAAVVVGKPSTWFWANTSTDTEVFYVRYGNATRPLRGPAQIHHMRSTPRDG
jgi:hypothetical protein